MSSCCRGRTSARRPRSLLALVGREHCAIGVDLPGQPGLSAALRPDDRDSYGVWLREVVRGLGPRASPRRRPFAQRPRRAAHRLGRHVDPRPRARRPCRPDPAPGRPCPARDDHSLAGPTRRGPRRGCFAGWPAPALIFRLSLRIGLRSWGVTCARARAVAPSHSCARRVVPRLARGRPPRPIPAFPTSHRRPDTVRRSDGRGCRGHGGTLAPEEAPHEVVPWRSCRRAHVNRSTGGGGGRCSTAESSTARRTLAAAGLPEPALGKQLGQATDRPERDQRVDPAEQNVDEVVLRRVDERERHRPGVRGEHQLPHGGAGRQRISVMSSVYAACSDGTAATGFAYCDPFRKRVDVDDGIHQMTAMERVVGSSCP